MHRRNRGGGASGTRRGNIYYPREIQPLPVIVEVCGVVESAPSAEVGYTPYQPRNQSSNGQSVQNYEEVSGQSYRHGILSGVDRLDWNNESSGRSNSQKLDTSQSNAHPPPPHKRLSEVQPQHQHYPVLNSGRVVQNVLLRPVHNHGAAGVVSATQSYCIANEAGLHGNLESGNGFREWASNVNPNMPTADCRRTPYPICQEESINSENLGINQSHHMSDFFASALSGLGKFETDFQVEEPEETGLRDCGDGIRLELEKKLFVDNRPIKNFVGDGEKQYKIFDDGPHPLLGGLLDGKKLKIGNALEFDAEDLVGNIRSSEPITMGFAGPLANAGHIYGTENNRVLRGIPEYFIPSVNPALPEIQRSGDEWRWRLRLNKTMALMNEDTLFYIFYNWPGDAKQLAASHRLYLKNWRFHIPRKTWITALKGENGMSNTMKENGEWVSGIFKYFKVDTWAYAQDFFLIKKGVLEGML